MAVWKKVLHENSPVADFPSLTAAKISDFDTEVTNNVTVAANGVFATTVHYLEAVNLKVNLASTSLSTAVLHGNDNDITDIGVSGTLPVANGGTGVTSKTGTGANVQATSPTLVTPVLGTPASGNLANCSGLPAHSGALITSGTVASARLDSDTAHLSGTQTFSGAKTFSATLTAGTIIASSALHASDNMFMDGGQFYIGSAGATEHDSWRMYGYTGEFILQSNLSGTWTNRLAFHPTTGNATFANTVNATTFVGALTGNASGSSATCSGLAGSATVLATARSFRTNLASTSGANFTGAADCTPGVTGTLPVANGGTALTSISTLLNSNVTSVSGNAGTATILATSRNIAGNSFNGSSAITIDIEDLDNVTVSDSAANGSPSTGDIWIEY